jgi:hypothetical protein
MTPDDVHTSRKKMRMLILLRPDEYLAVFIASNQGTTIVSERQISYHQFRLTVSQDRWSAKAMINKKYRNAWQHTEQEAW